MVLCVVLAKKEASSTRKSEPMKSLVGCVFLGKSVSVGDCERGQRELCVCVYILHPYNPVKGHTYKHTHLYPNRRLTGPRPRRGRHARSPPSGPTGSSGKSQTIILGGFVTGEGGQSVGGRKSKLPCGFGLVVTKGGVRVGQSISAWVLGWVLFSFRGVGFVMSVGQSAHVSRVVMYVWIAYTAGPVLCPPAFERAPKTRPIHRTHTESSPVHHTCAYI
jgi:hypothetical protein